MTQDCTLYCVQWRLLQALVRGYWYYQFGTPQPEEAVTNKAFQKQSIITNPSLWQISEIKGKSV